MPPRLSCSDSLAIWQDADVFTSDDFWSRSSSLTSHNSDSSLNEDRAFRMRMKARQGEGHPGRPRSIDLSIADVITRPRSRSSSRSSDRGLDNSLRGIEEAEEEEEEEEGAQTGDSVWEAAVCALRPCQRHLQAGVCSVRC